MKSIVKSHPWETQMVVLSPDAARGARIFHCMHRQAGLYRSLLAEVQRFRGKIYLEDGAISRHELTEDGRHVQAIDAESWHVLSMDREGRVCGCLRFLEESLASGFDDLWVRHSALGSVPLVAKRFRRAVEWQMARAKTEYLRFGEVGGWAVAGERRWTLEPLRILLATYGLLQLLGGCIGVATATLRHGSAEILRRVGLAPLVADGAALPPYYDSRYGCEMEVLQFDSRRPNSKYKEWILELASYLQTAPVICGDGGREKPAPVRPKPHEAARHLGAPRYQAAVASFG
ncbi:MAG TPA: hypothetical protein VJ732_01210 [Bryobacteraceae bacterium]|nr:hypothetical protein [Bryobacteraceae bacterium]